MRLNVSPLSPINRLESVNCQLLNLINDLASAVIAFARISFCILVGADGPHSLKHIIGHIVFRCDKFEPVLLPFSFFTDKIEDLNVLFHKNYAVN